MRKKNKAKNSKRKGGKLHNQKNRFAKKHHPYHGFFRRGVEGKKKEKGLIKRGRSRGKHWRLWVAKVFECLQKNRRLTKK